MTHHQPPKPLPKRPTIRRPRPRAAAPVVLQIGDLVTINGQLFTVSATLVPQGAAPVPTPTPTPIPTPAPVIPQPVVNEFRDVTRQAATNLITGGGTFWIYGKNFGAAVGTLTVNAAPLVVLHWDDQWIEFVAPPFVAGAPSGMWQIARADATAAAGTYTFQGPPIQLPPPVLLQREQRADPPPGARP